MTQNLATSLSITLVGMTLVFGVILLFWLFMVLLVRLPVSPQKAGGGEGSPGEREETDRDLRRLAVTVAVAVALANEAGDRPKPFPLPPTALVSTWQAVMRAGQFGQRGPVR